MKRQHFPDRAMFTKGEEQVFRIEAVIELNSRRGVDHCIDRIDDSRIASDVLIDTLYLCRKSEVTRQIMRGKQNDPLEAQIKMMPDRRGDLNLVFRQNKRDRPFGKAFDTYLEEMGQAWVVGHCFGLSIFQTLGGYGSALQAEGRGVRYSQFPI
jgi:hypothetical protein